MKNKILPTVLSLFFVQSIALGQIFPVTDIAVNGTNDKRINIVFLGDGYTAAEQAGFINNVSSVTNDMFLQPPFSNYAAFFNVYAIEVPSVDSGADHPGTATDVSEPAHPVSSVDTRFDCTFDYFDIHRLLVAVDASEVYTVLNNNFPGYDEIFVLSNSPYYGGSGGSFATSSVDPAASEIAIHEIAHSFADLSDEYWAGDFYARENANMTQETDPALVAWANWYGENGIGIYQHSGSGNASSWYRPHQSCKMRYLGSPFCSVCTERIIDEIYSLVSPLENVAPSNAGLVNVTAVPQTFDVDVIYPVPNTLSIDWTFNGEPIAAGVENVSLDDTNLIVGMNTLTVTVTDNTALSRSYWPGDGYVFSETWQINYTPAPCTDFMILNNSPVVNGIYHAAIKLSSKAAVSGGAFVDYKAGTEIELNPDFEVVQGAVFSATIENCTTTAAQKE